MEQRAVSPGVDGPGRPRPLPEAFLGDLRSARAGLELMAQRYSSSQQLHQLHQLPEQEVAADSSSSPTAIAHIRKDEYCTVRATAVADTCDSTEQLPPGKLLAGSSPPVSAAAVEAALQQPLAAGTGGHGLLDPGIRRYRTAFRPDQIKRLENEFNQDNYISRPKRNELAKELGLSEGTIKVWFQNRRMKHKRQQMTSWPLDPRFTDPTLAAMLLQAAVVSGAYPYPAASSILPPFYRPITYPGMVPPKCRLSPYPSISGTRHPHQQAMLLPPRHALLQPPLPPAPFLYTGGNPSPPIRSSAVGSQLFRPFQSDSPTPDLK